MARVEATVPEARSRQLQALAEELGVSRSQVVEEALALYLTAAVEVRRGRRVALCDAVTGHAVRELLTPGLSQLEWSAEHEHLQLHDAAFDSVATALEKPRAPNDALKRLMRGKGRK